ncbi:MAG TPA: hypothetical protein VGD72_07615 [Mycobacteriales bacterium]|jgi:hypothetical protein
MGSRRLVVRTLNSVYELYSRTRQFRRVEGSPAGVPPLHRWRVFHRMGPVVRGEPMRFWWLRGDSGRVAHTELLTTAPVVEVTEIEAPGDPPDEPA